MHAMHDYFTQTGPTILLILDGFGIAPFDQAGNAITPETAPHFFQYMQDYPSTLLAAHGEAVGLRADQEGNSEAGHLNIGAGRIVEQDLVRISHAIKDESFFENAAFAEATAHLHAHKGRAHVMGLLTGTESAHASPDHLYALLDYLRQNNVKEVFLHLFTDGRDASPHSAVTFLQALRQQMQPHEKIASIMGRFYGMDRNKIWERTEAAYEGIVCGIGHCTASSAEEAITQAYNRGETDEYICPTVILHEDKPIATVKSGDAVFFFNARSDRARQLTKAFLDKAYCPKHETPLHNIAFVGMSDFGPNLPGILTAFPSPQVDMPLAQAIGKEIRQLYIAETEKYAHVTYFINGGYPEPVSGEVRELIPSAVVDSYTEAPSMQTPAIVDRVIDVMAQNRYDFICINLCNADMLGHTGDFEKTKESVHLLDKELARLVPVLKAHGGQMLITADHGNAEMMIDPVTHGIMTAHTDNPVPCVYISSDIDGVRLRDGRGLADVAPSVLAMLRKAAPSSMTGESLFLFDR